MCISSKNDFPIPGRDLITTIFNIAQVLFPPRPHLQGCFPKCHDAHILQKWVFIYLAPDIQKGYLSTLKWGHGGISFLGHVYEMGVIKSRPGTLLDPDFLIETHNSPKSAKTYIRPIPKIPMEKLRIEAKFQKRTAFPPSHNIRKTGFAEVRGL